MRRLTLMALLVLMLTSMPARGLAIQPAITTDGAELTSATHGLDGQVVCFEGEVVSETLAAGGGHVWINVLSGGVAVGVWMPQTLAACIEAF